MSRADDEEALLPPEEEAELLSRLEAALRPVELDPEVHERLLALALEDPLAPPTEAEQVESQRLRDALESGAAHPDVDLLRALGAPFTATGEDDAVERALAATERATAPRRNVVYVLFGAVSAGLAAAAAVALLLAAPKPESVAETAGARPPELVTSRSTTDLFDERFQTSGTTARMDRIATARGRDLRDNRFAAWGVR